jgi:homoserine O-succinyltransferase
MSGARAATERQFKQLLSSTRVDRDVRLRCFCAEGAAASSGYADVNELFGSSIDGIIVTGAEPQSRALREEPLWRTVVRLLDWAEEHRIPAIWSCLAAHAAVLYLDDIDRRPFTEKLSGVFAGTIAAVDHPLMQGLESPCLMPHSRWNDLPQSELESAGYRILVKDDEAGVSVFTKTRRVPFVFFQGHPEYDADTLLREFQRDARRYQCRERTAAPSVPRHYFPLAAEVRATALRELSPVVGTQWEGTAAALTDWGRALGPAPWLQTSAALFRNWLLDVSLRKGGSVAHQKRTGMLTSHRLFEPGLAP